MSQKKSVQFFVYSTLLVFVLSACAKEHTEETYRDEIRYFLLEHLDGDVNYYSVSFQKIDNGFLMSDMQMAASVLAVQDTVKAKMNIALKYAIAYQSDILDRFSSSENDVPVDLLDEVISENVRLDKALAQNLKSRNMALPEEYRLQQQLFSDHILSANERLSDFNLSAYHLDFNGNSIFYLHTYLLNHTDELSTVFELNAQTLEVVSFKDI